MEGIRILEVAEHTFVPAASAILADWGADVIKIEHVERGDAMRGLLNTGLAGSGGVGPRPARALEPRQEEPRARPRQSCRVSTSCTGSPRRSDVFLTNKMPGVRERLKIDVDDIRAHNPKIVYVRGTGTETRARRRRGRLRLPRLLGAGRLSPTRATPADLDG